MVTVDGYAGGSILRPKRLEGACQVFQNILMIIIADLTRKLSKSKMRVFFGPEW